MSYGNRPAECSGNCSGWQSFRLVFGPRTRQLQPLESPLHCLWCRMDVPLRNRDAAVTGDPHDGERIHSRFPQPSEHCMAQGVENEIGGKDRLALAVHLRSAHVPVKVIDAGAKVGLSVPVGENKHQRRRLFPLRPAPLSLRRCPEGRRRSSPMQGWSMSARFP